MTFPDEYCGWYHAGSAYTEKCKFDGKKKKWKPNQSRRHALTFINMQIKDIIAQKG